MSKQGDAGQAGGGGGPVGGMVRGAGERGGARTFVSQWLKSPTQIGAIAPSSRGLALRMLEGVNFNAVDVIVEYGPGSGAFTEPILAQMRAGTAFIPVELNPTMAGIFRSKFPHVKLHERSAAEISDICRGEGLPERACVDVIFSGLPWAAFAPALQETLLDATLSILKPGGRLITFTYNTSLLTKAGRRFARVIEDRFARVETSATVLFNVPPAFVYRCFKGGQ